MSAAQPGGMAAFPHRVTKVVHLVRHGKGFHNDLPDEKMYEDWKYFDAHLTKLGWAQSDAVRKHIQESGIHADIIVASPLTRTLETAAGCFGGLYRDSSNEGAVFMNSTAEEPEKCTARNSIQLPGVPVVACEHCRETLGAHPCDKRRTREEAAQQFPGVDFSGIEEADILWQADERESAAALDKRAYKFAEWLLARPEKTIAVVSHSGFLHAFSRIFGDCVSGETKESMLKHFENCEMRSVVLADPSGTLNPEAMQRDPWFFPGGNTVPKPTL